MVSQGTPPVGPTNPPTPAAGPASDRPRPLAWPPAPGASRWAWGRSSGSPSRRGRPARGAARRRGRWRRSAWGRPGAAASPPTLRVAGEGQAAVHAAARAGPVPRVEGELVPEDRERALEQTRCPVRVLAGAPAARQLARPALELPPLVASRPAERGSLEGVSERGQPVQAGSALTGALAGQ